MMRRVSPNSRRGFTLIELVMVVAIILAIAAFAIPNILSAMASYRLKSTMSQAAGLLQQQRMTAVRLNSTYIIQGTTSGGRTIAWFEATGGNNQWDPGEPMMEFPSSVTVQNTGHPGDAAAAANITNVETPGTLIQFNARGLPCVGTPCSNNDSSNGGKAVAFVVYFQGTSSYGKPIWGAVTITPAGRIRSWFYNGSSYSSM